MNPRTTILALLIALAACSKRHDASAHPQTPSPTRATTTSTESESHRSPDESAHARAVAEALREARALVEAHRDAEALPLFERWVASDPGNPRLHCETGFVAMRAGAIEVARRELSAGLAIFLRAGSVTEERRVPYAMCLYNAGVLAERSGEREDAIAYFEHSLALRANATVERHLTSARAMQADAPEAERPPENRRVERRRIPGGAGGRTATLEHMELSHSPDDAEQGCFEENVTLFDPVAGEATFHLVGACPDTISAFRDFANMGASAWVEAGAGWGSIFTVRTEHGGLGDSEPDRGLVDGYTTTLFAFAVRNGAWVEAAVPVQASERADCRSDPCDDPDSTEDDAEGLRAPFEDDYDVSVVIAEGRVRLAITSQHGALVPPEAGEHPLEWLFETYRR